MTEADTRANTPEYTVSELSFALKRTVEDAYGFVRVRGEITGYKGPHSSGHAYFCLKDQGAKLDAVVWRSALNKLRFKPEDGLEVVATGKLTTYPGKSTYQLIVDRIEPAGAGALMALLEERKRKLAAEGLFDASRKQLPPELPRVIGVVTSPTGAVIRDILHRLADRFPSRVIVWPVRVQGETAAAEVAAAIRGFNELSPGGPIPRPDVLIVARGGGSLEDLWPFNEEIVVRAAAGSAIPLVSAIGHETDTTLIDHAADVRAPTPTAAAELVVPVRADLLARVEETGLRLVRAMMRVLAERRRDVSAARRAFPKGEALLALPRQRLDMLSARLPRALVGETHAKRLAFSRAAGRLSPATMHARIERARGRTEEAGRRLDRALSRVAERRRDRLDRCAERLAPSLLARPAGRLRERLTAVSERADAAFARALERRRARLVALDQLLRTLSYRSVLERGFALVRGADGTPMRSAKAASPGARLSIEFADGRVSASVEGGAPRRGGKGGPPQSDLFG